MLIIVKFMTKNIERIDDDMKLNPDLGMVFISEQTTPENNEIKKR